MRGLAAWSVAIPHFFLFAGENSEILEFSTIFAVEVFFVLSGFVLGHQLNFCFEQPRYSTLSTFFLRRWLRTLPIFFVVMFSLAALNNTLLSKEFFQYATFTTTWLSVPAENEFFVPAWSLAVEEWFYLLFPPFLVSCALLKFNRFVAIAAFIGIFLIAKGYFVFEQIVEPENLRRITFIRLDAIALGYTAFLLTNGLSSLSTNKTFLLWLGSLFFGTIAYLSYTEESTLLFIYSAGISAVCIVVAARYSEKMVDKSKSIARLSAFLAHTSYCTYLCHLLIFQLVYTEIGLSTTHVLAIYITAIIGFSVASFYIIERPFLLVRPNYRSNDEYLQKTHSKGIPFKIASNLSIFLVCLFLVEALSGSINKVYKSVHIEPTVARETATTDASQPQNDALLEQFENDSLQQKESTGGPFRYASYTVYENREFSLATINIDKNGERFASQHKNSTTQETKEVWVFGASPVYGATNADQWTIPARMQQHLSKDHAKNIIVRNFGVVGYSSWQSLLLFQKALMQNPQPHAVVAFLTNNDISAAWNLPDKGCTHLMQTGVGSDQILTRSWENLSRGKFFFTQDIVNSGKSFFPEFLELSRIFWKIPKAVANQLFPNAVKESYKERRDNYLDAVRGCIDQQKTVFQTNLRLMADLAKNVGATFYVGTLPQLSATKKKLSKNELSEKYTKDYYFFALTDSELDQLERIPNQRISQKTLASRELFGRTAVQFEEILKELTKQEAVEYLSINPSTDSLGSETQLFSTSIHFTHEGADLVSKIIVKQMKETHWLEGSNKP